ncbi:MULTISPECIES: hypothetical protein [unclassified Streptomyces]|uniref:hypothetical protein n=1 Tax=unclassified Streptomyces TaxID=2593676 RepID=UPI002366F8DF|nr:MULTISPECIES: hypothetical protein [unclassified Streptomyces]MDF3141491.1 hypothetical protein [Streptomyces sp. T21Q-yed]WDF45028.1 hypothetical protein PBV52_50920 [Streptomyces sp. T12]
MPRYRYQCPVCQVSSLQPTYRKSEAEHERDGHRRTQHGGLAPQGDGIRVITTPHRWRIPVYGAAVLLALIVINGLGRLLT